MAQWLLLLHPHRENFAATMTEVERECWSRHADRLEARYRVDHNIDDRLFWFAGIDGVRDLFSGFAYQATVSGGVGYTLQIVAQRHSLLTVVGDQQCGNGEVAQPTSQLAPQTLAGRGVERGQRFV